MLVLLNQMESWHSWWTEELGAWEAILRSPQKGLRETTLCNGKPGCTKLRLFIYANTRFIATLVICCSAVQWLGRAIDFNQSVSLGLCYLCLAIISNSEDTEINCYCLWYAIKSLGRASALEEGFLCWQMFVLELFLWCLLTPYIWGKRAQCQMLTGPSSAVVKSSRPLY